MLVGASPIVAAALKVGGFRFLLDELSGHQACYSLKKKRKAYAGDAIEVRRSSDDALADIGFLPNGKLDEASLESHIGAGQGFVRTWYDQSGSNDAVQTTNANQPEIVKIDGLYTLKCTGGDFLEPASFIGAQTNSAIHVVWKCPITTPAGHLTFQGGLKLDSGNPFISPWWTTQQGPAYFDGAINDGSAIWDDASWRATTYAWQGTTPSLYEFGADCSMTRTSSVTQPNYGTIQIGKHGFANGDLYISEVVVFNNVINKATTGDIHFNNYPELYSKTGDMILAVGDSLTTTLFAGGNGRSWIRKGFASVSERIYAQALGGKTIQNWNDDIDELTHYASIPAATKTAILWVGTNDMFVDGTSGAATLTKLKTLAQSLRAAGFNKVVAVTALPRNNDATFETKRNAFNTALKADVSGDFDEVTDTTSNANLEDENDATYFNLDLTHLNETGNQEVGTMIKTSYDAL